MLLLILINDIPGGFVWERKGLYESFEKSSLKFIDNGRLLPLDLRTMADVGRAKRMPANAPAIIKKGIPTDHQIERSLDTQIGKANRERLLKGGKDLKLHIVIDSPGGSGLTCNRIQGIINWVQSMNGKVMAYAFRQAASAAVNIFSHADIKFALRNTELLCHIGSMPAGAIKIAKEQNLEPDQELINKLDIDDFTEDLQYFFKGHTPEFAEKIKSIKAKAIKTGSEVIMTGEELAKYGVVKKAYLSEWKLYQRLLKESGIDISKNEKLETTLEILMGHYNLTKDISPDDPATKRLLQAIYGSGWRRME